MSDFLWFLSGAEWLLNIKGNGSGHSDYAGEGYGDGFAHFYDCGNGYARGYGGDIVAAGRGVATGCGGGKYV